MWNRLLNKPVLVVVAAREGVPLEMIPFHDNFMLSLAMQVRDMHAQYEMHTQYA